MISRYCQQGDIDGATQILEFMREKQLPVNENVFNALIMGHSNAEDLESATGIISVMAQAGLEPSADTYTTLLCGYARKGDIDAIVKHISTCEAKEIHLLDKDLLEIVYALAVNGHEDKIDSILSKVSKSIGYNQDAVNVILRLINKGHVNSAMAVLKTMPRNKRDDGEYTDAGSFVIRQLIKAGSSLEPILSICKELEDLNMHTKPLNIALEEALTQSKTDMAFKLLEEMKERGIEIRQHYFWPIIASTKSESEMFKAVEKMNSQFGIEPNGQCVRDYIIPKINTQDYDKIVLALRNIGLSSANASTSTAYTAIKKNDLKSAANIMSSYSAYFAPVLFRKPILFALLASKDFESYGKVLRCVYEGIPRLQRVNARQMQDTENEDEIEDGTAVASEADGNYEKLQSEIMGSFVIDALMNTRNNKMEVFEKILETLVANGLSIAANKAEVIQNYIGEKMTTEISTLLDKLTSGELEPVTLERRNIRFSNESMSSDNLERLINRIEEKGGNTKNMKKQLLIQAIRAKDLPKTEQLIEKLKSEGYVLGSGVYALLFELYAMNNKIEEATKIFDQIRAEDPEFTLDDIKTVRYIQALIETNRIDEAFKFMEANKRENIPETGRFAYNSACWRILNVLAEKGDITTLNQVFNTMIENNFASANNVLLGPLIKVHVIKNEIKEAVDKFEEICTKYRSTPWKNELSCKLIQMEDAENLQRVTDLSTDVHGEVNSLYDLVFSFIECGRIRQARKILETPGLRMKSYTRINLMCERFVENGKQNILEGLVEATKDLNHIDRSEIYYNLLQTYIKEKASEKCLEMWTKMQEENISASDNFLIKLAEFLESEGMAVPFTKPAVIEEIAKKEPVKGDERYVRRRPESSVDDSAQYVLKMAIRNRNDEEVNDFIKNADYLKEFETFTIFEKSKIIEALVRNERLPEATDLIFKLLNQKLFPRMNIFRFYLNRIASKGENETIDKVGQFLDEDMKRELSFDNRYCHSFVSQGKVEDYLTRLENEVENIKTEEDIKQAEFRFPRGGAIGLLEASPNTVDRFEALSKKYAEHRIIGPMNVLWIYHFIHGDTEKADKIFKEYLSSSPRLMFHRIIQFAREKNDIAIAEKLIGILKNASHVTEGAIGNVYSALIDIQVSNGTVTEILETVKKAVDSVCLENINVTALTRAKYCVESAGKTFPYKIPDKKAKKQDSSSSSSSSSDDEVTKKESSI